jgi:hypothetical protein
MDHRTGGRETAGLSVLALIRRSPLLTLAVALALVKAVEFAIDSTAIFYYDSGSFLMNALGLAFIPERSYFLAYLIRILALPFHSLKAVVILQMAMGALTAWLLAFVLIRYFGVSKWMAMLAAILFACDPVQIVHEHLVLAETGALLATALFLLAALSFLEGPGFWKLALIGFLGAVLVAFRILYVPVVITMAVVLPLRMLQETRKVRVLLLALAVSCGSTLIFQMGYRSLTGKLAKREPAYHYTTGFFLAAGIAPLIKPVDADEPRVAQAVEEQNRSSLPLARIELKPFQLWDPNGLARRIRALFPGDLRSANQAADKLARHAVFRDPIGFLKLGLRAYALYWTQLPDMATLLPDEDGAIRSAVSPFEVQAIQSAFGSDVSDQHLFRTPSRRFHWWARWWHALLLVSPLFMIAGFWLNRQYSQAIAWPAALFLLWSCLLMVATCMGAVQSAYRFLHPFSFIGLAGVALFAEGLLPSAHRPDNARLREGQSAGSRIGDGF